MTLVTYRVLIRCWCQFCLTKLVKIARSNNSGFNMQVRSPPPVNSKRTNESLNVPIDATNQVEISTQAAAKADIDADADADADATAGPNPSASSAVTRFIGRGTFGSVFVTQANLSIHKSTAWQVAIQLGQVSPESSTVAVKIFHCWHSTSVPEQAPEELIQQKLEVDNCGQWPLVSTERRIAAFQKPVLVRHPHLLVVLGEAKDVSGDVKGLVMPAFEICLKQKLASGDCCSSQRLIIAQQAAMGLEALHSHNLLHSNIKSSNLLLKTNGTDVSTSIHACWTGFESQAGPTVASGTHVDPVVLFGSTQLGGCQKLNLKHAAQASHVLKNGIIGTLGYMAPEIMNAAESESASDLNTSSTTSTDVFAFGVVLAELVSGRAPTFYQDQGSSTGKLIFLSQWMREKGYRKENGCIDSKLQWKSLSSSDSESESESALTAASSQAAGSLRPSEFAAEKLLDVTKQCTELKHRERPAMQQVVKLLMLKSNHRSDCTTTSSSHNSKSAVDDHQVENEDQPKVDTQSLERSDSEANLKLLPQSKLMIEGLENVLNFFNNSESLRLESPSGFKERLAAAEAFLQWFQTNAGQAAGLPDRELQRDIISALVRSAGYQNLSSHVRERILGCISRLAGPASSHGGKEYAASIQLLLQQEAHWVILGLAEKSRQHVRTSLQVLYQLASTDENRLAILSHDGRFISRLLSVLNCHLHEDCDPQILPDYANVIATLLKWDGHSPTPVPQQILLGRAATRSLLQSLCTKC